MPVGLSDLEDTGYSPSPQPPPDQPPGQPPAAPPAPPTPIAFRAAVCCLKRAARSGLCLLRLPRGAA
eukprot:6311651-Prymnesium_polylepis.1